MRMYMCVLPREERGTHAGYEAIPEKELLLKIKHEVRDLTHLMKGAPFFPTFFWACEAFKKAKKNNLHHVPLVIPALWLRLIA